MTTPAWIAKLLHELIVYMAERGLKLPPRDIDMLRNLLRRSIGAHTVADEDDDVPTDPAMPAAKRKRMDVMEIKLPPKPPRRFWP